MIYENADICLLLEIVKSIFSTNTVFQIGLYLSNTVIFLFFKFFYYFVSNVVVVYFFKLVFVSATAQKIDDNRFLVKVYKYRLFFCFFKLFDLDQ